MMHLGNVGRILEKRVKHSATSRVLHASLVFSQHSPRALSHHKRTRLVFYFLRKSEIDNKKITCGLFLDFSKAFDTVDYEILLAKLYKYGIRGTPLTWFSNYLNNRQQYVKIGNTESDYLTMTCGVPQGSTLGPLLFILYINDMPNCSNKLSFRIFADDSNVFYSSTSIDDVERVMNEELNHIFQYCDANKLSVNINKTNFMVITSNKRRVREIQLIRNIKQKNHIKYLGIYIDKNLSWEPCE